MRVKHDINSSKSRFIQLFLLIFLINTYLICTDILTISHCLAHYCKYCFITYSVTVIYDMDTAKRLFHPNLSKYFCLLSKCILFPTIAVNWAKSLVIFCHQVAACVPKIFCNFYFAKYQ